MSATPGPYELRKARGVVVEQIIRPTGLIDPPIEVRPVKGQVDDLLAEIRDRVGEERTRAGDDAHEADGGRPHAGLPGARRERAVPPLRHRDARAGPDSARPAPRRVRRACRPCRHPRGAPDRSGRRGGGPDRDPARDDRRPSLVVATSLPTCPGTALFQQPWPASSLRGSLSDAADTSGDTMTGTTADATAHGVRGMGGLSSLRQPRQAAPAQRGAGRRLGAQALHRPRRRSSGRPGLASPRVRWRSAPLPDHSGPDLSHALV